MRKGTLIATRGDGATIIYDGIYNDDAGILKIPMGLIAVEGEKPTRHPLLSLLVHGGWTMEVSESDLETIPL